jgi:hypothetical protein
MFERYEASVIKALRERDEARAALRGLLTRYVNMVESGDCGFWDAEKEPEVIAARAALEKSR